MTRVATEYAQALYSLAREEGVSERILEEMNALGEAIRQNMAWLRILAAPNLPKEERCALLDAGFRGKLHPYVLNFLKLMTDLMGAFRRKASRAAILDSTDSAALWQSLIRATRRVVR